MNEQIDIHERLRGLEVKVDSIMNNHLPHIYKAILFLIILELISIVANPNTLSLAVSLLTKI